MRVTDGGLLFGRIGQEAFTRIDGSSIDPHFIVKVGTGAPPGVADQTDGLAFADMFSFADQYLGEMGILSCDLLAVI